MEKLMLTCEDLDAVGVYFIAGKAELQCDVTRVNVCEEKSVDNVDARMIYLNLKRVVCFEDVDFKTRVYYGSDAKSQQLMLDCTIDDVERLIASVFPKGKSRYVRMGNYYIVNQQCFDRISLGENRLYVHSAKFQPFTIDEPQEPSRRDKEEFRPLVPNYTKHKLADLQKTMPGLVAYMIKYKRHKSFVTSLRRYKELVFEHYGIK